eukprot:12799779-Ditylum_brightwellii.AAC.1
MDHRSIRSLMAGSLHQVWQDIGTPTPSIFFKRIYGGVIHSPINQRHERLLVWVSHRILQTVLGSNWKQNIKSTVLQN